jgi:uncharacterized protein (TIGR03000 family)
MYSVVLMAALTAGGEAPAFFHGCHGSYGGYYGAYGGYYSCFGCYGSYACYGCYGWGSASWGGGWGSYGVGVGVPALNYAPVDTQPMGPATATVSKAPAPISASENRSLLATRARLVVELPADAKLFVDEQRMKTTSSRRVFYTPVLEPDKTYSYLLRAEIVRDGKTRTASKRVIVRPGEEIEASFADLGKISEQKLANVER